jgi:hypothetical protein
MQRKLGIPGEKLCEAGLPEIGEVSTNWPLLNHSER